MLIFYAFTALQLVNMYNIRVNLHPNEEAELYIDSYRIPSLVIEYILKSNKFNKVIILNQKNVQININRKYRMTYFSKIFKILINIYYHLKLIPPLYVPVSRCGEIISFFQGVCRNRLYVQPFFKYLRENPSICSCTDFFAGTCGSLSSIIISILLKRVKTLEINLVDEGIANYYLSKTDFCLEYKNMPSLYTNLMIKSYHLDDNSRFDDLFFKNLLEITNKNYLLQPNCCLHSNQYSLVTIPQINNDNRQVLSLLRESILEADVDLYRKRHVYYMLQKLDERFEKCLSIALEQINHSELLLKEHPLFHIMDVFSKKYDLASVEIDKRTDAFIFEALCTHYSFDDRVIITNFSSSAFMPKFMFGSEPSVVFLYNLILDDDKKIIELDYLVDALKKLYSNPTKVYVPKTFDELSSMLIEVNKVSMCC